MLFGYLLMESGTMTKCSFDPTADIYKDAPIGMFHCPECGEMVVAGIPHPDYDALLDEDALRKELEEL